MNTMTGYFTVEAGRRMKTIRRRVGMSVGQWAKFMRVNDMDGIRQMERGKRAISGPMSLIVDLVDDGKVDPWAELIGDDEDIDDEA